MKTLDRRTVISGTLVAAGAYGAISLSGLFNDANARPGGTFKISQTPEEWKRRLGPARYRILRQAGTERAYSSPLNKEKRKGVFACAGCNLAVYGSDAKYDSGTGWPSFWKPIAPDRMAPARPARGIVSTDSRSSLSPLRFDDQLSGASTCCQNSSLIPSQSRIQANLP